MVCKFVWDMFLVVSLHIGMKVKPFSPIKILTGCRCMDLCIGEWYNI